MAKAHNPPWLMWGSTQLIAFNTNEADPSPAQLAAIDYGRPDSWTFFLQATILERVNVTNPSSATFFFDLVIGVGRSTIVLPGFESYVFTNPVPGQTLYSASVNGPPRFTGDVGQNRVESFCAQTIQLAARAVFTTAATGRWTVSASGFLSPRTHVRPDWYGKDALGGAER